MNTYEEEIREKELRAVASGFTAEQAGVLARFEVCAESQDLSAMGHGRRTRAEQAVAYWYGKVKACGLCGALTDREKAIGECQLRSWPQEG